jgi:hypothetical protein
MEIGSRNHKEVIKSTVSGIKNVLTVRSVARSDSSETLL